MAKSAYIGFRVEPAVKAALDRAAATDQRPTSALVAKIVMDWLKQQQVSSGKAR